MGILSCDDSKFATSRSQHLFQHWRSSHGFNHRDRVFQCDDCPYFTTFKKGITLHTKKHGANSFKCNCEEYA